MGEDFLSFPIHQLIGRALYAFPPQKIALKYFKRLCEIAAPWALVVTCFEAEPAVLMLAREKKLRIFNIPRDSILTPANEKGPHGYWKAADNIAEIKVVTNRL